MRNHHVDSRLYDFKLRFTMRIRKTALLVVLILGAAFSSCDPVQPPENEKILIAVSINPLVSLVQGVVGDQAEVVRLVPPAASPHTYEPTPSQVATIGRADVLVLIGMGLEFWSDDLISAADNPDLLVVDTSKNVEPIEHNHHIWLDPLNAISQVELIRDALTQVDPEHASTYGENTARYIEELRTLDQEVAQEIEGWSHKAFIAFHPAWVYFAKRYGLAQAAAVEETPGHEASAHEMTHIIEDARRLGVRAIFAEPQLPAAEAETIAEESGAEVLFLDPLGGTEAPDDYMGLIRYNVQTMAKAMK
jgi:zinc transport system substrate-binding protein